MIALAAGLAVLAAASSTNDPSYPVAVGDYDAAVRRLRACVTSGIGGAPRDQLAASLAAIRSLCGRQIRVAQAAQERRIELEQPAPRTAAEAARLAEIKTRAMVRLNDEIALLVARLTGVRIDHAASH